MKRGEANADAVVTFNEKLPFPKETPRIDPAYLQ